MNVVDLLLRLLHIVPAIFLAGGIFFMWGALLPALNGVAEDTRKTVLDAVRGKWAKIVMATSGLLLVTGLINFVRNASEYAPTYHILGTVKLLLALGIMFIAARLAGRSAGAEKFRERIGHWMTITTGLLFALILLASMMRVMPTKVADAVPGSTEQIEVDTQVAPATN